MLEGVDAAVHVEDCTVRYVRLGLKDAPPLMLVHGGGAHRGWWLRVAPQLAQRYVLVVPDLSGHGDSDYRRPDDYSPELWAAELAAIIEQERSEPVTLVGHSMGGLVGVFLASRYPNLVERLILVDSKLRRPGEDGAELRGRPRRPKKMYPTREAVVARFRLRPPGTSADPALLQLVGRQAVTKFDDGWTWKFDHQASQRFHDLMLHRELPKVSCPVGMVYGEHSSVVGPETVAYIESRLRRTVPAIVVPNAHHHVPLDDPDLCRAAIEELVDELAIEPRRTSGVR